MTSPAACTATGRTRVQEAGCPQRRTTHDRCGPADLLALVGAVRRLAFDRILQPAEALGRIMDHFTSYDDERIA